MAAAQALFDAASLQGTGHRQIGYRRAAAAIVGLDRPIADVIAEDGLLDLPHVGPSSARIVIEVVSTGRSDAVDAMAARAGRRADLEKSRRLREGFLSYHAAQLALAARLPPSIVDLHCFRGDLQMHSTYSDGREPLRRMAEACRGMGHTRLGITDHSHGLPVARGMSTATVRRQHREIESLNQSYAGTFRILKGIEANILADGGLDLAVDERRAFEFVVASPHSQLRGGGDQTARMVRAVRERGVAILGHPRGRMFDKRAGVEADWVRVFAAAADAGVAVEIDGNWHRQDLDAALAAQALAAGCLFALDSDAHSLTELRFTELSVAHARIAAIPADRVVNCWDDDRLAGWMASRRLS